MIKIYVVETKRVQMGDNWSISDLDAALSQVEGDREYFATLCRRGEGLHAQRKRRRFPVDTYDHYDFVGAF